MLCEVSAEVGAKKGEPALVDSLVNGFSGDGYSSIAKILAKDSKTLRFELVEKQGKEQISATMDLDESALRKGKTQVKISVNVPSASQVYRTTATVNISGIKKAEDLAFRTEGGKSVTAAQKKVSAGILHSGFRRWEDIMRSDANSSLRDLGFTRLQDIMIENKSK